MTKLLLEHHADATLLEPCSGETALHTASAYGHRDVCALLLRANDALLDVRDVDGELPADQAYAAGDEEPNADAVAQLLRDWRGVSAFAKGSRNS
jgi:ankyrin repeat protein